MKNILVTGGAGFIGSNFLIHMVRNHSGVHFYNLDKLTYAGNLENLKTIDGKDNYTFIEGDICDHTLVKKIFTEHQIDTVAHFAAESHVDNSISGPKAFIDTNINGTFNLLDIAREQWMNKPGEVKPEYKNSLFLHVSTDEVYGTLGETGLFEETTPYAPNSPYSASKASSDFLVRSYFHTYGLNMVITNCSNNYGPHQHDEKLIPVIIRNALAENPIPIYGDGKNVRDWLYVVDHCKGIELAMAKGQRGESYNIGGRNEKTNLEIVDHICAYLDELRPRSNGKAYRDLVKFVADRPGHDKRYAIDASKIENNLGWMADETFSTGIKKTVDWYLNKYTS